MPSGREFRNPSHGERVMNSFRRRTRCRTGFGGLDEIMADAVTLKYLSAPLAKDQVDELIKVPLR